MVAKHFTGRKRVLAALHKQETDRLCWAPLIDPYFIDSLPKQNIHLDIIEAMRYIGCDIIERHVAKADIHMRHVSVREEQSTDRKKSRVFYDTPVGSIYEERSFSGKTNFITKHFIETVEDIKIFQYISEHTTYEDNISIFMEREKYIGEDGIATTTGPPSPIQQLLQKTAGVENTVYLMADYPDEMDELLHHMHEANKRQYRMLAEYPTEIIFSYEDTSSTVMSRSMFRDYSLNQINDYTKILHGHGKLFITHMCGKLSAFAEDIAAGKQDGIDSVCPPSTGDLCVWDARRIWGADKVIIGGIEPPALASMTVRQTVSYVDEIIMKMKDEKGFLLSTGDAVPYGTPIENLIAVTNHITCR